MLHLQYRNTLLRKYGENRKNTSHSKLRTQGRLFTERSLPWTLSWTRSSVFNSLPEKGLLEMGMSCWTNPALGISLYRNLHPGKLSSRLLSRKRPRLQTRQQTTVTLSRRSTAFGGLKNSVINSASSFISQTPERLKNSQRK